MKPEGSLFTVAMTLAILTITIWFTPLVKAQAGEVTLEPTADTYVDLSEKNSNFGGRDALYILKDDTPHERIAWLKFTLSGVPDNAAVDMATLQLGAASVDETYTVYAHACADSSWTELALTYSNMPNYNHTSMDSTIVATRRQLCEWNVVDAVRNVLEGASANPRSVTIVLSEESIHAYLNWVSFYSKEETYYTEYVPTLTIHWSGIVPEFSPLFILSLFVIVTVMVVMVNKRSAQQRNGNASHCRRIARR